MRAFAEALKLSNFPKIVFTLTIQKFQGYLAFTWIYNIAKNSWDQIKTMTKPSLSIICDLKTLEGICFPNNLQKLDILWKLLE